MADRMLKVNELLRQELSKMVQKELTGQEGIVTVTDVDTTPDLQLSTVHISIMGREAKITREMLQKAAPAFHGQLAKILRMKFIPKLKFEVNDEARAQRVEKLLEELP